MLLSRSDSSSPLNPSAGLGGAPVSDPFVSVTHRCPFEPFRSFPQPQTPLIYCCRLNLLSSCYPLYFLSYCSAFYEQYQHKNKKSEATVLAPRPYKFGLALPKLASSPPLIPALFSQQQTDINLVKRNMFVLTPPLPQRTLRLDKASPQPYASQTFNRRGNLWSTSSHSLAPGAEKGGRKQKPKSCCCPRLLRRLQTSEEREGFS